MNYLDNLQIFFFCVFKLFLSDVSLCPRSRKPAPDPVKFGPDPDPGLTEDVRH